jgi:hypothetical protein
MASKFSEWLTVFSIEVTPEDARTISRLSPRCAREAFQDAEQIYATGQAWTSLLTSVSNEVG